jgi:hypothetical protein
VDRTWLSATIAACLDCWPAAGFGEIVVFSLWSSMINELHGAMHAYVFLLV